ncbi:hypothetical protein [Levilactobacillus enshiensis]|uniref:hypothetical protein n=1 Tax=Levilactobacillus enshiensis TaxID=2590213 RepID=UPI00117A3770|nr:hypothetical protein [Levilactobacillus enshiensis]
MKSLEAASWKLVVNSNATTFYRLVNGILYLSGYADIGGNYGNVDSALKVADLPAELQGKNWIVKSNMIKGLTSGDYALSASLDLSNSQIIVRGSAPNGWTTEGIVIFNCTYTQG